MEGVSGGADVHETEWHCDVCESGELLMNLSAPSAAQNGWILMQDTICEVLEDHSFMEKCFLN